MKYDDASWHFGGDYPGDLPQKNAYTHIGVFLAWALINGLAGELHTEEWPEEIEAVKTRTMTGAEFLAKHCDGKFTDEDLTDLGNAFCAEFYENEYFERYINAADPEEIYETVYHIPDTWETYDKVALDITQAFSKWKTNEI